MSRNRPPHSPLRGDDAMDDAYTVSTGSQVRIRGEGGIIDRLVLGDGPAFERSGDAIVLPPNSALGKALMGRQVGDEIEVKTRARTVRFTIEAIEG